jgi:hypothetical protein
VVTRLVDPTGRPTDLAGDGGVSDCVRKNREAVDAAVQVEDVRVSKQLALVRESPRNRR